MQLVLIRNDYEERFLSSPPVFLCCVASSGYSFWHNLWKNLTWSGDLENEISSVATLLFRKKHDFYCFQLIVKAVKKVFFYMRQIFLFVFCPGFCFDSSLSGCQGYIFHCVQKPDEVLVPVSERSAGSASVFRLFSVSFSIKLYLCCSVRRLIQ